MDVFPYNMEMCSILKRIQIISIISSKETKGKRYWVFSRGNKLSMPRCPRLCEVGNNGLVSRGRSSLPSPCSLCNPMTSPGLQSEQRLWSEHLPREGEGFEVESLPNFCL